MPVEVRIAGDADREVLARLFYAVEAHYSGEQAPTREAVARHVGETILTCRTCEIAIAEMDGRAVGLATFGVLYPAPGLGGHFLMKDLFTVAEARGQGVGRALLRFLARLAIERRCVRLDWTAETDNPAALSFYDRLGARRVTEKVYFRFDGEALAAFANGV